MAAGSSRKKEVEVGVFGEGVGGVLSANEKRPAGVLAPTHDDFLLQGGEKKNRVVCCVSAAGDVRAPHTCADRRAPQRHETCRLVRSSEAERRKMRREPTQTGGRKNTTA